MTGHCIVKRLNKSGNHASAIDWDDAFKSKDNPKGLFKMVVLPIRNSNGDMEVKYCKTNEGIMVSGEGYIVTGFSEKEINKEVRKHYKKYANVVLTKVDNEKELW